MDHNTHPLLLVLVFLRFTLTLLEARMDGSRLCRTQIQHPRCCLRQDTTVPQRAQHI